MFQSSRCRFERTLLAALGLASLGCVLPGIAVAANTDILAIRTNVYRAITTDANSMPMRGRFVVPPSGSLETGTAVISVNDALTQMSFNITHNVVGETSAAIRGPGYAYENGPILFALPLGSPKIGTWNFTPPQFELLKEGRTYIEIRSGAFPGGAIRCQIQAQNPPVQGRGIWVRMLVQNLGPDTYFGTIPNKAFRSESAVGRLKITIDIDEPLKPTLIPNPIVAFININKEFAVTIAPSDSIELDMGLVPGYTAQGGTLTTDATAIAQAPNVDMFPANDRVENSFIVLGVVPGPRGILLGLAAAGLVVVGGWTMRRRRLRS